jgi:hypothetical protein
MAKGAGCRVHPARESKNPRGLEGSLISPGRSFKKKKNFFEHDLALSVILSAKFDRVTPFHAARPNRRFRIEYVCQSVGNLA